MIVIYTGDIKRKQVSAQYNIGAVKVTLEPAFLSELDSGSIFRNIKEKVEKKELLAETELMEFIILPLSYRNRDEKDNRKTGSTDCGQKPAAFRSVRYPDFHG